MKHSSIFLEFSLALILCTGVSWALDSEKVQDEGCVKATPDMSLQEEFISKVATWFVPFGHAYFYNTWVEKLTNQSATPDKMTKLCLKFVFLASSKPNTPYMIAAGGLNKILTYECSSTSLHSQNCAGVIGSPGYQPGVESEETIIKTDNKNYVVMLQCIKKKFKSWYIMTATSDPLPQATIQEAVKAALALGFDSKKSAGIAYTACPKPK